MVIISRLVLIFGAAIVHSHPCDPEAAKACPFDGGPSLGVCLRDPTKHEAKTEISAECQAFLDLMNRCDENLASGTCSGTAYTDDAILCLTQWLNKADLTEECKSALPEEKKSEEPVLDEETLAKRARRKRARAKAAEEVRKLNEQRAKEQDPPKKTKTSKAKSKRKAAPVTESDL